MQNEETKMAEYHGLVVNKEAPLLIIRINRPEVNCRINMETGNALARAIEDANQDKDIKVIILTGTGEYFCGGGQVNDYPDAPIVTVRDYLDGFAGLHDAMFRSKKPIIGAINGHAVAGGFSLTDTCDLAVAGKSCKFGLPELGHGQFPMIALATTGKSIPKKEILEICFTCKLVGAEKALEWHLINEIVDDDKVLDRAKEIGMVISQYSSAALAFGRETYYRMNNMNLEGALNYSKAAALGVLYTEDAKAWAHAKINGTIPELKNM